MTERSKTIAKRLLVVPPIAAGLVLLGLQLAGRSAPEQAEPTEVARSVRVIDVQVADYVPRALGYGYVQPGSVWEAVAEVAGKVVYRAPNLERGRVLGAGTVILRIDPTDYELAVARTKASLDSVAAQLAELRIREANTKSLLEIERRALGLADEDLKRKKALFAKGNASQLTVDQAENGVLAQQQKVQELENQLSLLPAERRVLEADRALKQAQLREAELDLERTEIRLPFDARIAEVEVEAQQFVNMNEKLAVADSIDVAEVSAQLAIDHVRPLIPPEQDLGSLGAGDLSALPGRWGLSAVIRLRAGNFVATWDARFDRISDTVDPQTRTVGFIVAVDEPYRKAIPGKRPPLIKNLYVEVELRAPARPGRMILPRVAVEESPDGQSLVYVADGDNRLRMRPVTLEAEQSDFVVVASGLEPGERIVVTDLEPAIDGLLLAPTRDDALAARMLAQAAGTADVR